VVDLTDTSLTQTGSDDRSTALGGPAAPTGVDASIDRPVVSGPTILSPAQTAPPPLATSPTILPATAPATAPFEATLPSVGLAALGAPASDPPSFAPPSHQWTPIAPPTVLPQPAEFSPQPSVEETVHLPAPSAAGVIAEPESGLSYRARALGELAPTPDVITAPQMIGLPSTYGKFPSFTIMLLRFVVAALMGIRAVQDASHLSATTAIWENTVLPSPQIFAWGQICVEAACALLLVFGIGVRLVGALLVVLNIGLLAFVYWGAVSPFQDGVSGFTGELQILLIGVGLLLIGVGGGGWLSVDSFIHRDRVRRRNERS
jgi:uncharacterized membrane protein YphA (DoxX/SURF4 family)